MINEDLHKSFYDFYNFSSNYQMSFLISSSDKLVACFIISISKFSFNILLAISIAFSFLPSFIAAGINETLSFFITVFLTNICYHFINKKD
ncbi:hypothetical protein M1N11_00940 [Peptococcaceae bacterium]|nr:hypothetical protein [Peptococcaceae bacterium]